MSQRIVLSSIIALATLAALAPGMLLAEEGAHADSPAHGSHPYHTHILALFVGGAHEEFGRRENGAAIGIEYEYRFGPRFGVGAILEHTYGDLDTWVYAIPFAYHNGPWKFYAAPGIEEGEAGSERMLRLGVEYGFHVGRWEISPQVDIDVVEREGEVYVLGLTFARGFDL